MLIIKTYIDMDFVGTPGVSAPATSPFLGDGGKEFVTGPHAQRSAG